MVFSDMTIEKDLGYALKETVSGDKKTRKKLLKIKKDIIKEYITSIKDNDPNLKKVKYKTLENYLINDGTFEDVFKDALKGYRLSILLPESIENLNIVKEKISAIQKIPTSEELSSLKSDIMNIRIQTNTPSQTTYSNHDSQNNQNTQHQSQTVQHQQSSGNSGSGGSSQNYSHTNSGNTDSHTNETSDGESLEGSAPVGEAKEIELKKRMQRLFPEGVPQTEKQMRKYLTKIKVPIITENGKTKTLKLHVHKKLANEYKAIFEDMKKAGIKVNPNTTACFNWRKMRKSSKMSHHSYGTAIDVNRDVNGGVYGKTDRSSPYFNDQATVDIRKKHGFYWGGDWSKNYNDPMHFTYMNA